MKVLRPVDPKFRISSPFGERRHPITKERKFHRGIDFACPQGTPVKACFDGTILLLRDYKTPPIEAGNRLGLYCKNVRALYMHLDEFAVKMGQTVKKGDILAFSGNTGASTGPHLHFELRDINSDNYFEPEFEDENNETPTTT